jgi:transposase
MPHVIGEQRNQLFMINLEQLVPKCSFARAIDVFVDAIDLESFGFAHVQCKEEGRPSYHPSILMKLYLYGYHYGIRTSRKLEREAQYNLEALWLTSCQYPKYKTIADFRKNHSKAFRAIFRRFVVLLKEWELIDGTTIAIDSFKIRAQNSLKNNLNQASIDRHLEYIEAKIDEYESQLEQSDKEEEQQGLRDKIQLQNQRKAGYLDKEQQLVASGEDQLSLTDPDARSVILHRNIVQVGYNVQASSDSKNKLLVEYETGDVNDTHALSGMAIATKGLLGLEQMKVLADKGYHTGEELSKCEQEGITTFVSPKAPSTKDTGLYPVTSFIYDKSKDIYTCPAGEALTTNKVWHKHSGSGKSSPFQFQRYTTPACKCCQFRDKCTQGKANGRAIDRSQYAGAIEENNERVNSNPDYYRQRQQVTEHPFGTLKRQRGFTFTLMKGKEKVLGEVGLEFTCYNLTRCMTILGIDEFIKMLNKRRLCIFSIQMRLILDTLKLLFSELGNEQNFILVKLSSFYWPENKIQRLNLCFKNS